MRGAGGGDAAAAAAAAAVETPPSPSSSSSSSPLSSLPPEWGYCPGCRARSRRCGGVTVAAAAADAAAAAPAAPAACSRAALLHDLVGRAVSTDPTSRPRMCDVVRALEEQAEHEDQERQRDAAAGSRCR